MITHCKFCEKEVTPKKISIFNKDFHCEHCKQYSTVYSATGFVESETLRVGNYYLTFFPAYKTASVVETKESDCRALNNFEMNELTHEQAVHWVQKLKTYCLFQ